MTSLNQYHLAESRCLLVRSISGKMFKGLHSLNSVLLLFFSFKKNVDLLSVPAC